MGGSASDDTGGFECTTNCEPLETIIGERVNTHTDTDIHTHDEHICTHDWGHKQLTGAILRAREHMLKGKWTNQYVRKRSSTDTR